MATKTRRRRTAKKKPEQPLDVWDRQPGETDAAFKRWIAYRDMEVPRSLRRLARELGMGLDGLAEHSTRWGWQTRAAAWDNDQARQTAAALQRERERAGKEHASTARAHMRGLLEPATELLRRIREDPQLLQGLPIQDLLEIQARSARALNRVQAVERLALGMSTENIDVVDQREQAREEARRKSDAELRAYLAGEEHGPGLTVLEGGKQ